MDEQGQIQISAGSDPDIAGSSSENDDQRNRRAPFNRRHLSRDSGCYDSHKRAHASPQSDASDHGDKNNLDSVVEQCNNEILARVRQAQQNQINLKGEVVYDLNIPVLERRAKDSYVSMHGQTSLLDPSKRGVQIRKRSDEFCESDQKFSVKYVANSEISEQVQLNIIGKSCLSEKSSDSGVSSSSLSSTLKERDNRPIGGFQHLERSNNCANTSITANKRT